MSILQVRNASKHFGRLVAVNGVSLEVQPGELRAVIGPNGAGKTTFFNLISGFFPPTSGSIVFDGVDITRFSEHKRVEMGMARTFQITEIFPELTARENVRVAVEVASGARLKPGLTAAAKQRVAARVEELLEMGGLGEMGDRLVGELSHGDQRATEIMMSLALNPRLLLLDEPTAGTIVYEGKDVTRVPAAERTQMGMARTFQVTEIFPELTVRENLRIAVEAACGYRLRPWLGRAADAKVRALVDD
ncbi:MAG TPA: ATP-binding cassette domain-containing protein, partial [Usitatibacter sp.]|nr:ATP-binding cassette domain-containing protein [Usitatibacter sp.]